MTLDLERISKTIRSTDLIQVEGRVQSVVGLSIQAVIPGIRIHELVCIDRPNRTPLYAEVVGFNHHRAMLLPLGITEDIGPNDIVRVIGQKLCITFGDSLLGRILDGLGRPIDGGPEPKGIQWNIMRPVPNPLSRPRIHRLLPLGIRAIDGLISIGEGQRIGLFSGSGVGKSTLLGQIARQADADVFVVCLVGERGRELGEFIQDSLGEDGLQRGVVVCATSDTPALIRMKCPYVATAIAEGFRDQGKRVVLLMDSITRFARAAREAGLSAGESPVRRGYPPSVFSFLPMLLERCGTSEKGSITAFYTILVEGDDFDDPISDEMRGLLDGHIFLSRELGNRGRWPAIDVSSSLSRLMNHVTDDAHYRASQKIRQYLSIYETNRDLIMLGTYRSGSDPQLDDALCRMDAIEAFLTQSPYENINIRTTIDTLTSLV